MKIPMVKKNILKHLCATIFLAFFVFMPVFGPVFAEEGIKSAAEGLRKTGKKAFDGVDGTGGPTSVTTSIPLLIGRIVGAVLAFLGLIFFLLMIYAGIKWMTARGDSGAVTTAKDTMEAAVIGLVITLAAYAITAFIGNQLHVGN